VVVFSHSRQRRDADVITAPRHTSVALLIMAQTATSHPLIFGR
jgi:hypothetical protein